MGSKRSKDSDSDSPSMSLKPVIFLKFQILINIVDIQLKRQITIIVSINALKENRHEK